MLETKEDVWDKEIEVSDGANTLKEIFKPDYERTKDLDRVNTYMSAEWSQMVRLLKKRLRHEGETQHGVHFIRRRLTIAGIKMLYDDNKTIIDKHQEKYDINLETFNPLSCILAMQPRSIYQHEHTRRAIFLKEETLGWIQDLADMFNLSVYSIVRVAWSYTILKLIVLGFLPSSIAENAKSDVEIFKEYLLRM